MKRYFRERRESPSEGDQPRGGARGHHKRTGGFGEESDNKIAAFDVWLHMHVIVCGDVVPEAVEFQDNASNRIPQLEHSGATWKGVTLKHTHTQWNQMA